jgi:quercetin dioxygenase-like cupin family protein
MVDTQEVRIKAGDLVVERNTMHSWRNEGTEPVTMAITVVTAVA